MQSGIATAGVMCRTMLWVRHRRGARDGCSNSVLERRGDRVCHGLVVRRVSCACHGGEGGRWTYYLLVHGAAKEVDEWYAGLREEKWPDEGARDGTWKGQVVIVRGEIGGNVAGWEAVAKYVVSGLEGEGFLDFGEGRDE